MARTLSEVLGLVTVTELDGLVDTGRSARGNGSAEEACSLDSKLALGMPCRHAGLQTRPCR